MAWSIFHVDSMVIGVGNIDELQYPLHSCIE